jgi:UDP-N-acetylmuramate dehydrogenase
MPPLPFLQSNEPLSHHTTIGLGGPAKFFAVCKNLEQIHEYLRFAKVQRLPVQILGEGSNIIFPDEGFRGLVLRIALRGVKLQGNGDLVEASVGAGELWDPFVELCIEHHLAGVECLSGIPGSVGATPIQNVGAYGQEISSTFVSLKALQRETLRVVEFSGKECGFAYRHSRFKSDDADKYIITEVTFRLRKFGRPEIRYSELSTYIESHVDLAALESGQPALKAVRQAVLVLRRKKSMVINRADPNSRSVGSFFVNPVLSPHEYHQLEERCKKGGISDSIPVFPALTNVKIPAAWLVEKSGFHKGYRRGGVGISSNHALALVNYSGSTREILDLAAEIQARVFEKFQIRLEREPVVVNP